jgi:uncharacterized protein YbjT (DUF2867 family)
MSGAGEDGMTAGSSEGGAVAGTGGGPSAAGRSVGVTGATGYVGGRLVPRLLDEGYRVRCLARSPGKLDGRPWRDRIEVVRGDVLDPESLAPFLDGLHAVYYLVHAMAEGEHGFEERDRRAARGMARAAARAGVGRIVYLGGLGETGERLSRHLASRLETGRALREGPVPVTELRAAVIVGSGSMSFEMIRALVERLPVMITPKWVNTRSQPIAITDVLRYLVGCLAEERTAGGAFDIGGADVLTYRDMMLGYARARGLRRVMIPVPVLSPRLSSYWVDLITPIPASYARPLIQGLKNEVVVRDHRIRDLVPFAPMGYDEAVRRAMALTESGDVETRWTEASLPYVRLRRLRDPRRAAAAGNPGTSGAASVSTGPGEIVDVRTAFSAAPPEAAWRAISGIGGRRGWYAYDTLWNLRGLMDRMSGGVGMRRGRRDPDRLRPGDALDFWRVEAVEPGRALVLRAEMKVPGEAWLEFRVEPGGDGTSCTVVQRARFRPAPFWGRAYWTALLPVHAVVFRGMVRAIAERAERMAGGR